MPLEGDLNIVSQNGSEIEVTMWLGPMRVKEHSIWLLHLLNIPGFLKRYSFKQNTLGRAKVTFLLRRRSDWEKQLNNTKLSVLSLITKTEGLNTSS